METESKGGGSTNASSTDYGFETDYQRSVEAFSNEVNGSSNLIKGVSDPSPSPAAPVSDPVTSLAF